MTKETVVKKEELGQMDACFRRGATARLMDMGFTIEYLTQNGAKKTSSTEERK